MKNSCLKQQFSKMLCITGIAAVFFIGCEPNKTVDPDPGDGDTIPEDVFNQELYNLRLTEIHYNPADDTNYPSDSLEFVELKNIGSAALDMGTLEFTDGIRYVFPEGTSLAAGAYYVVASSGAAFQARYGKAPDGVFTDQLSNKTETIILKDVEFQEVIFSEVYADSGEWSGKADGDGYSLVAINENYERTANGPQLWRKSAQLNGSPGAADVVVAIDSSLFSIRITEIHYHPLDFKGIDGDSLEFIELKNVGTATLDLSRLAFTNGITYSFPVGATLAPDQFIVLVSDVATFKERYTSITPFAAYAGQLSNTGEKITLIDLQADETILSIDYKDSSPWPDMADGGGASLVPINSSPSMDDQDNPSAWRMSFYPNGSPGADDEGVVLINEVLTHTDPPDYDAVELYNPGTGTVNIGGWYLSDSKGNPAKFKIPDGTEIAANGYLVFTEADFNADPTANTSFTLNSHGEEVWLFSNPLGCDEGYCYGVTFGELENSVSIGRYINSEGEEMFVPQINKSLNGPNDGPRVGPLIISEIMYHSADDDADYVEITNIDIAEVSLSHPELPDFTWKIAGTGFSFPASTTIKPNESVIIASDSLSIEAFRAKYSLPEDIQVFQMSGGLQNGSETLKLEKPEDPYIEDSTVSSDSLYPYMVYDIVDYSDQKSWPSEADGSGKSLQRVSNTAFGNDPASWKAADPTPGKFE